MQTDALTTADTRARRRGFTLGRRPRRALLTTHIVASVGLLGEVSGFLVVAIRASASDDPAFAATAYDLLATFSAVFGIPLSMVALASGILLGLGTKWGVLRSPWVAIKLSLLASVVLVGALVLGPGVADIRAGGEGLEARVIAGATWDVAALLVATGLSVYKPGRPRRRARSALEPTR
jgi:hypothetical protein